MDLLKNLNSSVWKSINPSSVTGLTHYTIVRREKSDGQGRFRYAIKEVKEDGGHMTLVTLEDASGKTDPLSEVLNVDLLVQNNKIITIHLEGDAVTRNS